ncbi:hypothetical protein NP233_g12134 [Leucocoprinus birnbaumii]|uniref:Uncharacterized protein n=1 Tax=Leucocoprinus birnbaumii TaxID=56174 RepID=A0AAD5YKQ0_9AGAR|nr:hypothetical protein NP233_g12134 [Leucocoprinus birnbaumii]
MPIEKETLVPSKGHLFPSSFIFTLPPPGHATSVRLSTPVMRGNNDPILGPHCLTTGFFLCSLLGRHRHTALGALEGSLTLAPLLPPSSLPCSCSFCSRFWKALLLTAPRACCQHNVRLESDIWPTVSPPRLRTSEALMGRTSAQDGPPSLPSKAQTRRMRQSKWGGGLIDHPKYGTVIGIDLGSTVQRGGHVEIIANNQGPCIKPSWVSSTDEEHLAGDAAKNTFHSNPQNTVFDTKRLIGRKMDDPDIKRDIKHQPPQGNREEWQARYCHPAQERGPLVHA